MNKVLFALFLGFCPLLLKAQNPEGNYNPYLGSGTINPQPLWPIEAGGTGVVSFNIGNSGSDQLEVFTGHQITLTITLSYGEPDNVNPLLAVGGTSSGLFSWSYNSGTYTYTATQIGTIPANSAGNITIAYKVTQNSTKAESYNGFNVNLTPAPYEMASNTPGDDAVSSYTWTEIRDFGDAPVSYGSADHIIDYANYIGSTVDGESANQPSAAADADDANGIDDEDGVTFPTLTQGATVIIPVSVVGGAYLNVWIDWNGDGDFNDTGERIVMNSLKGDETVNLSITVPVNAITSAPTFARFRFGPRSTNPTYGSTGSATFGEVEDYQITIECAIPATPTVGTIIQPTCDLATGSVTLNSLPSKGTWTLTLNPGGVTTTGTGTSTTISGLSAGTYTYTVTNSVGCTSLSSNNAVINTQPITPSVPVVGTITQPTCTVETGSVVLSSLPAGDWTITRTPGGVTTTGNGVATTISDLPEGTYSFTVTNDDGCISPPTLNVVIAAQPESPSSPVASVDCSLGFNKAVITVTSPLGASLEYSLDGGTYQSGTIFSNVANGSHTIIVRNSSGCTTTGVSFSVSCGCVNGPTITLSSITGSTCGTLPVTVSGNTFGGNATSVSITENGAGTVSPVTTSASPFAFTYTPAAGDPGTTVTITLTTNNPSGAPCAAATATYTLSVNANPSAPAVGTITQPTCLVSTGSVVLNGLPSSGTWTLTRNPEGITTSGTGTSTTISNLLTGTYNFTVTNDAGCISGSSTNVIIAAQPATPFAPAVGVITHPTCTVSTGSVVLSGLPSSGTWTLTRYPGTVTTSGTGTSTTLTTLATGIYNYTVTNAAGCVSSLSSNVVIDAQPLTPSAPIVGTITQPTCAVSTGSVVFSGLPSIGTWTINPGVISGTGTSTIVSGLATGTLNFTVTNSDGCTSVASVNVVINAQPATPSPPVVGTITHPTCSVATGSVVLSGLPSSGTWTLTRTPGGLITTGTGTNTTISGLAAGTHNYTVTNAAGCTSVASANVVINAQPVTSAAPTIGTITQTTCAVATGSVVLSSLPAGTWTLTRTPGGTTTGTGISTIITGLAAGTYTYTVSNAATCVSVASGNVVVNTQPATPTAPAVGIITQPTCAVATGSVVLSGLPAGNWTINPGSITGSTASTTISGLAAGTYTYTVTNAAGCTSEASSNVVIPAQPATPTVVITNPAAVCSPSKVDLTAPAVTAGSTSGLTYTYWTIAAATIAYATPATAGAGTYYIKGTTASGCYDIKPVTVTVNALPAANAGTGGSECDLNFKFNAVASIGAGTWTVTTGTGTATFAPDANTATATVTVSEYGTYTFTWTEVSNNCSKSSTITVNFNQQPVTNAGTGGNNCGPEFFLEAVPSVGIGTWTKTAGSGTATFTPNANVPNAKVTVSAYGLYTFTWTEVNGACSNSASVNVNFLQVPAANAGTDGSECDLDFILNAIPGTGAGAGLWTRLSGPGNAIFSPDPNQHDAKVTVDQFGTYDFAWTEENSTCQSTDMVRVVFHNLPSISAGKDTIICNGETIQFQEQGVGSFLWAPAELVSNPDISDPVAAPVTTTTFTVTLTDQFGCKNSDDVIVEVRENPVANAGPDQVLEYLPGTTMDAELAHDYETGNWSLISGTGEIFDATYSKTSISGLSLDENKILWTVTNGVCPASSDTVTIIVHDLIIPTLITPNMDGKNDYFVLRGIETLGKTELVIFDRRGAQVYRNSNYDNKWNGVDYNENPLPDDTYFFVLKTENGKSISGYIVIRR